MLCPKCRDQDSPLLKETYREIEVDRCPICKGIFLDRGELTDLVQSKQGNKADSLFFSATSDAMDGIPANCPKCDQDMPIVLLPGDVHANQCQHCAAIFLDQGELATLQLHYS